MRLRLLLDAMVSPADIYRVRMPVFGCGSDTSKTPYYGGSGGLLVSAWSEKLDRVMSHISQHAVTDPSVLFASENSSTHPTGVHMYTLQGVIGGRDEDINSTPC